MMHDKIYDLVTSDSLDSLQDEIKDELFYKILEVASLFGFSYLIDNLKIRLFICENSDFENKKKGLYIQNSDRIIAFRYDINSIFVLEYQYLKKHYSKSEYVSVIVHECVHVLQFYYSMLPSKRYVWLYESIACYLAGQKTKSKRLNKESWENFENNFYNVKDCYGVAYGFGEALFKLCSTEVFNIIKSPEMYKDRLVDIFNQELCK